jgi:parallel beta helix pectate lyase-like protein
MHRSLLAPLSVLLLLAPAAHAAEYYVDASCEVDGDGTADACATSAGGPGAWNGTVSDEAGGVQNCFNTLVAGDICWIKDGTYLTNWVGPDVRIGGGFHPANSGTATEKITYSAYPGHHPVLVNCSDGTMVECSHQTISGNRQGHIVYDGLRIVGAFYLLNDAMSDRPIEIKNCDVSVGWFGDGNWAGIYLEKWDGNWIHHNYFHDIAPSPEVTQTATGLKHYTSINSIVEFNTFERIYTRAAGVDDKYDSVNNVIRYNLFHDISGYGVSFNSYSPINVPDPGSGEIYGNVFHLVNTGVRPVRNLSNLAVYNNTFYDVGETISSPSDGDLEGLHLWNNLTSVINGSGENAQINCYDPMGPTTSDYNAWELGVGFNIAATGYDTLADVQGALGLDLSSHVDPCAFVDAGADFHLAAGSPCLTAGRVGGVESGAIVEQGAYGVTSCVGHTCDNPGTPPGGEGGAGGQAPGSGGSSANGDDAVPPNPSAPGCVCGVAAPRKDSMGALASLLLVLLRRRRVRRPPARRRA